MSYQYKIIAYRRSFYKEFEIPKDAQRVKLGTSSECDMRLDPEYIFGDIKLEFIKNREWLLRCSKEVYISRGDIRKFLFLELCHGDDISIHYSDSDEPAFNIRFIIDFEADLPRYEWYADLNESRSITIGNIAGADIELESEFEKDTFIVVHKTGKGTFINEERSRLGVSINGKIMTGHIELKDHDFISAADFCGYFKADRLFFDHKNIRTNNIKKYAASQHVGTSYPEFIRNTRTKTVKNEEPISILDPADMPASPEINAAMSLMPAIAMFALTVVLRGVLNTTGGSFVLFGICSMGLGVVTSVAGIIGRKKKYKKDREERKETYKKYIKEKRKEIEEARAGELWCLCDEYYSTEQDMEHIKEFSSVLFDRLQSDEDFLDVYLGTGAVKAIRRIDYAQREKLEQGDELNRIPETVAGEYEYIDNAPVVLKLKDANAVGIIGNKKSCYEIMKIMLLDLICRQYHKELNIYLWVDEKTDRFDWIRLLPNIQTDLKRRIVCDDEGKNSIFEELYRELSIRSESRYQAGFNVIFVMAEHGIRSHPLSKFIERAAELNTVFLFFEEESELLPQHCSSVIECGKDSTAFMYKTENKLDITSFEYSPVSDEAIKEAIELLAPVYSEEISLGGSLKRSVSLFEILGMYDINDLDLKKSWEGSEIYESMAVPLGINAKGNIVYLDIHEKHHGPHGLVAGTTGSGKSELLLSFVLGAAALYHPYEIGFMIIDFKGGGMVNQLVGLPHLIGAVTNIEGKAINRSLRSIKAELIKRQRLFAAAGVNHIDKYIKKYKEGRAAEAMPHLIIIVDEFAELKAEHPDFMKEVISTARIGRSLGVHLILATQKPAGQVNDQIWSNSTFRICLKVQTAEDSKEVLRSPLASEIREPGRAYLQTGNNGMLELFQSGFSGTAGSSDQIESSKEYCISTVDFTGKRSVVFKKEKNSSKNHKTQSEILVDHIREYCEQADIKKLPDICLPELPDVVEYGYKENNETSGENEMRIPIGLYDDPDNRIQEEAYLNISKENTIIIGASLFGKTYFLQLVIRSIAELFTAKEVNIYILDFGSMSLRIFNRLNHIGAVMLPGEDERIRHFFKFMSKERMSRKERFAKLGMTSFHSYKEAGYTDIPQIVIMIDDLISFKEQYPDYHEELTTICREGISLGICVIAAASQVSGIGYRYLNTFAYKIALCCNSSTEYGMIFDRCRIEPKAVPGRTLICIEKEMYEMQLYLAFPGKCEADRIKEIEAFISQRNIENKGIEAQAVPEIPLHPDDEYIKNNYKQTDVFNIPVGIDHESVELVEMDLKRTISVAVSGRQCREKENLIYMILDHLCSKAFIYPPKIFIIDGYERRLKSYYDNGYIEGYTTEADETETILLSFEEKLKERKSIVRANGFKAIEDEPLLVCVIENPEIFESRAISEKVSSVYRRIVENYKRFKAVIIFSDVPNIKSGYASADMLKHIKDVDTAYVFDDYENIRLFDPVHSYREKYKKHIEPWDAYRFNSDGTVLKIRTVNHIIQSNIDKAGQSGTIQ